MGKSGMGKSLLATIGLTATVAALAWAIPASAHTNAARATVVTVTAGKPIEFGFKLSTKSVKAGAVTFKVTNGGAIPHDFTLCSKAGTADTCAGKKTPMLSGGASATLSVTLKAGTYEYLCGVPGHAAAGMKGQIKVM
jgi:uncharacterized cupredoxin-like copper-binding protein